MVAAQTRAEREVGLDARPGPDLREQFLPSGGEQLLERRWVHGPILVLFSAKRTGLALHGVEC